MTDPSAKALLGVVSGLEARFRAVQEELRDQVFTTRSVDGQVELRMNGEGLALRVSIAPALLERGAAAVETAVMQAINDASLVIQSHTTAAFQLATAHAFGVGPEDDVDDLPPSLRAARDG